MSHVPLVNPQLSRKRAPGSPAWMPLGVRVAIALLALVAAGVSGYLTVATYGSGAVAACSGTDTVGCDEVLGSPWSKLLGLPVAAAGVLCYVAIFLLALLVGTRRPGLGQGLNTALAMLVFGAVGAGTWFTGVQMFAIGKLCPWCLAVHACGLTIAVLLLATLVMRLQSAGAAPPAVGIPGASLRQSTASPLAAAPWWSIALAGAAISLMLGIGAQLLFKPRSYGASTVALDDSVDLTGPGAGDGADRADLSPDAQQHVVNRVPPSGAGDPSQEPGDTRPPADQSPGSSDDPLAAGNDPSADEPAAEQDPSADTSPTQSREVELLGGRLKLDLYEEAVLGSREAPYVVVEMIDYTCSHCREMHEFIERALYRYRGQLAVVVLPVPLELECNKAIPRTDPAHRGACRLARLALSVAALDHRAFADFHNWLMSDDDPPSSAKATMRAFRLVNKRQLSEKTGSEEIADKLQSYIRLYVGLSRQHQSADKSFGLPVQILGDQVLTGKFESPDEMFDAWEEAIGIRPD